MLTTLSFNEDCYTASLLLCCLLLLLYTVCVSYRQNILEYILGYLINNK